MKLGGILLREASQTPKDKLCTTLRTQSTETRRTAPAYTEHRGRREAGAVLNGDTAAVWENEEVQDMDVGDMGHRECVQSQQTVRLEMVKRVK